MQDSAGHILGRCLHKDMKALYIARHDKAMRQLLKQLLHGWHGAHYVIAEVGTLGGLQRLGVHAKRIPAFFTPDKDQSIHEHQNDVREQV